jgi:hypothetical protein
VDERPPDSNQSSPKTTSELKGTSRFVYENRAFLGFVNIFAAIFLFYIAITGFVEGRFWLPLGFGLMGAYFIYSYVRNVLRVNLGTLGILINLFVLFGALFCLVMGMITRT